MINVNEHLNTSITRIEQIKNQAKSKARREREAQRKIDTRRNIIIGELVCKYFPNMKRYYPKGNDADIAKEFLFFESILSILAGNTALITELKEEAAELTLLG